MLHAVVEHGGFAQAADALYKSQSTISHAVTKLQDQLGIKVLEIKGRKAELTEEGKVLLRRSEVLLKESEAVEKVAASLAKGWEASVVLAVDIIFPQTVLQKVLHLFSPKATHIRLELIESSLSGTTEQLVSGHADLVITAMPPSGYLAEPLLSVQAIPVARFDHPLHQLGRKVTENDLKLHRQIVVRDSGSKRSIDAGWLGSEQRWTVGHISSSVSMVCDGMGFAWLPEDRVSSALESGVLRRIDIEPEGKRPLQTYMVFPQKGHSGLAAKELAQAFRSVCQYQDGLSEATLSEVTEAE